MSLGLPIVGPDVKVWANDMRRYLSRQWDRLSFRTAGQTASDDGIILWDAENGYPVVSKNGVFVPIILEDAMPLSQFGEMLTTRRTPIVEGSSSYGLTALRDVQTVSGSAAISSSATGEILLSTGATASSTARVDSAERIRYIPGYGCEIGIGIRIPTLPTGNQEAKWGIRNPSASEGIYFGVDATGFYAAVLRDSVETKTYQSSFNFDKYDGTGRSRNTLDLSDGTIFQLNFTWYGYGQVQYEIVGTVKNKQDVRLVHEFKPVGATSLRTPNLPLFVEATNGGDAADFDVYLGGRQAAIVGEYIPKYRGTSQYRASISTTTSALPLISFRNKIGFEDRSVQLDAAVAKVAANDHIVEFYLNPTLTGASWATPTNHTASETGLETDISATAMSGGTLVYSYYAAAGLGNQSIPSSSEIVFDVPENQIFTMALRTVTGAGTGSGFLRMQEEW